MTLSERAAYLKGLCEGFDLDTTKPKNKLINDMITLLGEMAEKIDELEDEKVMEERREKRDVELQKVVDTFIKNKMY